jgi:hypothetical protein
LQLAVAGENNENSPGICRFRISRRNICERMRGRFFILNLEEYMLDVAKSSVFALRVP